MMEKREIAKRFLGSAARAAPDIYSLLTTLRQSHLMIQTFARYRCRCLALLLFVLAAGPGQADPYAVVPGDVLRISYAAMENPETLTVDLDGQIILPDLGAVSVNALSLAAVETKLDTALIQAGLYLDPRVRVAIDSYAPVVVAGDVPRPGRFDYSPGLTIAAVLGLSGGGAGPLTQSDLTRARIDLTAQADTARLALVAAGLRVARLGVALSGDDAPPLSRVLSDLPPLPIPQTTALWTTELAWLSDDRQSAAALADAWASEAAALSAQLSLFDKRIAVQNDIVSSARRDLDAAVTLEKRGLQTTSRLSLTEQRDADARARVLELESARMATLRALAEVKREETRFDRDRREQLLSALHQAQRAQQDHARALTRASDALSALVIPSGLGLGTAQVEIRVQTPRMSRKGLVTRDLETPVLPGDILIVRMMALPARPGG